MLDNIPAELRLLPQWVVAGPDKNPINPRSGSPASVTDPSTWATFDEARRAGYMHLGFVLAVTDPYAIIDLDDPTTVKVNGIVMTNPDTAKVAAISERHTRIISAFNSYAEISQSGLGVHIIVRGAIPNGVRRDKVEVYSDSRYMICTGNVINNAPITDFQELLHVMHAEMASTVVADLEERAPVIGDDGLYDMAARASNAEKFLALFKGNLSGYPSQSEADFALLTMLCFYSKSDSQVRRVFRFSALGKRDKATRNDDYLNRALGKIRGRQAITHVDLTQLLLNVNDSQLPLPLTDVEWDVSTNAPLTYTAPVPPPIPIAPSIATPPGLIGEMATYIYSSAIRPVHEVALSASLAFGAGILGRHFNVSSTGLNQFLILLAKTGTGKEGAVGGIDALLAAIRPQIPAADDFVGPGTFASGQALTRVLDKTPCFVSVLGEVGITLQQICDKNAGAHNVQLRKVLLDIYAKSGWNKWLRPSVYSDNEKNTGLVRAPNVTILGESTPENFYNALDGGHIVEGLVPRFLVIEYDGPRPSVNRRAFHPPDPGLVARLTTVAQTVITMRANDTCCPVQIDRWADALLDEFNSHADNKINGAGEDDVLKQLWNRGHIKALKLAALVAVGCSVNQPIVTKEVAEWAIGIVHRDIDNMTKKFSTGEVGSGDHAQEADILKGVAKYPQLTEAQRAGYKVPKCLLDKGNIIPYSFLKRFLVVRASFKNDRRGAVTAIKIALDDMVRAGTLAMIPPDQAKTVFGTDSPVYFRGESYSI